METGCDLIAGVDYFTLLDLLRRAASHKGLTLRKGSPAAYSGPIRTYELDRRLLAVLAEHNIMQQDRPDCGNSIFTLVDENPQREVSGSASSNYWNFQLLEGDRHKFDLRMTLVASFGLNRERRGVVLMPRAHGSFLSACDSLPNLRMFRALVGSDNDAPLIANELTASDEGIVVSWTELGLGGIRSLFQLFSEFCAGNEAITQLGNDGRIFNPEPYPLGQKLDQEVFIAEPAQPRVFRAWHAQLNEYRYRLVA